jgi:hypothetical protein
MGATTEQASLARRRTPLNRSQIAGFWGAWTGWTLDGMDSFIYALVLTPALTEPVALTAVAFVIGLFVIPFAPETLGEALPQ